jgi:hypothetical protein
MRPPVWKSGRTLKRLLLENGDLGLEQFGEIVRKNLARHADGNALGAKHEQQRKLRRQRHGFLVAPVVAGNEFREVIVEDLGPGELGETALDVTRSGRRITREDVAEITLALDEVAFVRQHHQGIADGGVAVRVVLHAMTHNVGHLDKTAVVLVAQCPEDAPLHGLQTVGQARNGPVADDVGGILQKARVDAAMERQFDLARMAVARLGGGHVRTGHRFCDHFRLLFRCTHVSRINARLCSRQSSRRPGNCQKRSALQSPSPTIGAISSSGPRLTSPCIRIVRTNLCAAWQGKRL